MRGGAESYRRALAGSAAVLYGHPQRRPLPSDIDSSRKIDPEVEARNAGIQERIRTAVRIADEDAGYECHISPDEIGGPKTLVKSDSGVAPEDTD